MATAETAKMISELELRDKFTPTANKAIASTNKLEKSLAKTGNRIQTSTGKAFGNLQNRVKGLAGAIGPLVGVGGLLGLTGLLASSVNEASAFGDAVLKVQKVTNLSATTASSMVDTLDKWGVSSDRLLPILGKLEKNVGAITDKTKGAQKFQQQYGVSLLTSSGRIADANTLLLRSADYFNSNATATDKATFMAKLWGKAWQDLIPILSKGSGFIREQERTAIHLTTTQLANIAKFRSAQRDFADAFGDLQVKIGSEVMPLITTGLTEITKWFDQNEEKVTSFFHDAAIGAGEFAKSAGEIFAGLKASWEGIPPEVRDFLVKGLIADRTVKFLFGFSPISFATGTIGKAIGTGLGHVFDRGSSPANPLYVTGTGIGGAGGMVPGATGLSAVQKVFLVGEAIGLGAAVFATQQQVAQGNTDHAKQVQDQTDALIKAYPDKTALQRALAATEKGIHDIDMIPFHELVEGEAKSRLQAQAAALRQAIAQNRTGDEIESMRSQQQANLDKLRQTTAAVGIKVQRLPKAIRDVLRGRSARELRAQEETARHGGLRVKAVAKGGSDALTVIDYMTALAVRGTSPWYKKADNIKKAVDAAKTAQKKAVADGNTTLARKFGTDITILQRVVDDITPGTDRTTAAVKAATLAQLGLQGAIVGAIAGMAPPVVNVNVSATTVNKTTAVTSRYGSTAGSRGVVAGGGGGVVPG